MRGKLLFWLRWWRINKVNRPAKSWPPAREIPATGNGIVGGSDCTGDTRSETAPLRGWILDHRSTVNKYAIHHSRGR